MSELDSNQDDIYCACCGGKPDDSKLGNYDEHCYQCQWRYHETKTAKE